MPRKRHKPEEIVAKLRQVEVLTSQGQSVADAIRSIGVTEVTYFDLSGEVVHLAAYPRHALNAPGPSFRP